MVGLPNFTSVSQKLDLLYITYKNQPNEKAQLVCAHKTDKQPEAVERHKTNESVVVPIAHFNNEDLPEMIIGKQGDLIEERPFNRTFTRKLIMIMKSSLTIGWIPFTSQALKQKKARHMMGDGGTSAEMKGALEETQNRYTELKGQQLWY